MARRRFSSRGEKSRGLFTRNAAKARVFCHEQRDENERVLPVEVFRARDGGGREPHIYRGVCVKSYLSAIGFNNTHGSTKDGSSSSNKKIYVVGEQGLVRELEECDVGDIVGGVYEAVVYFERLGGDARVDGGDAENDHDDDSRVDAVVVGQDTSFTFAKLAYASYLIQKGAKFIATNPDAGIG